VTSTSLQTKFLLRLWIKREYLAILLANNIPQQQGQEKKPKTKKKGKGKTKGL
jgi:hypothetical protein